MCENRSWWDFSKTDRYQDTQIKDHQGIDGNGLQMDRELFEKNKRAWNIDRAIDQLDRHVSIFLSFRNNVFKKVYTIDKILLQYNTGRCYPKLPST